MKLSSLKEARKSAGYTQETFADKMNVSLKTVQNWEQKRVVPPSDTLREISIILNCDLDYLFGNIECTNHNTQFIHDETGLSEAAVYRLTSWNNMSNRKKNWGKYISAMIENEQFENMMEIISDLMGFSKIWGMEQDRKKRQDDDTAMQNIRADIWLASTRFSEILEAIGANEAVKGSHRQQDKTPHNGKDSGKTRKKKPLA